MPDGSNTEIGTGYEQAEVYTRVSAHDKREKRRRNDKTQGPVEPRGDGRKQRHEDDCLTWLVRVGARGKPYKHPLERRGYGAGIRHDHHDGKLHGQAEQCPQAISPRGQCRCRRSASDREGQEGHHDRQHDGNDPRVGYPALCPTCQAHTPAGQPSHYYTPLYPLVPGGERPSAVLIALLQQFQFAQHSRAVRPAF